MSSKLDLLTARERELLRLIAACRLNREIATELCISVRTVEVHKAHMISRLGLRNAAELLRYAILVDRRRSDCELRLSEGN